MISKLINVGRIVELLQTREKKFFSPTCHMYMLKMKLRRRHLHAIRTINNNHTTHNNTISISKKISLPLGNLLHRSRIMQFNMQKMKKIKRKRYRIKIRVQILLNAGSNNNIMIVRNKVQFKLYLFKVRKSLNNMIKIYKQIERSNRPQKILFFVIAR